MIKNEEKMRRGYIEVTPGTLSGLKRMSRSKGERVRREVWRKQQREGRMENE